MTTARLHPRRCSPSSVHRLRHRLPSAALTGRRAAPVTSLRSIPFPSCRWWPVWPRRESAANPYRRRNRRRNRRRSGKTGLPCCPGRRSGSQLDLRLDNVVRVQHSFEWKRVPTMCRIRSGGIRAGVAGMVDVAVAVVILGLLASCAGEPPLDPAPRTGPPHQCVAITVHQDRRCVGAETWPDADGLLDQVRSPRIAPWLQQRTDRCSGDARDREQDR